ncbi:MAG: protein phosphatase 2C domain-containing protein [Lentisphaeria bacterium]|nr:protein phosphatase 2C domain-containing protein [Lentisphaeria bacterium]
MKYRIGTATEIGGRNNNEDAFFLAMKVKRAGCEQLHPHCPFDLVAIVSDGMGGGAHGELASATAVEFCRGLFVQGTFREWQISRGVNGSDMGLIFHEIAQQAHEKVCSLAAEKNVEKMGATFDLIALVDNTYHFAHVGDGRIIHVTGDKIFIPLTDDHNVKAHARRQGIASGNLSSSRVTSILGMGGPVQIDVGQGMFSEGDGFLLYTDGADKVEESDFIRFFNRCGGDPAVLAATFAKEGVLRGGKKPDNATVVWVQSIPPGEKMIPAKPVMQTSQTTLPKYLSEKKPGQQDDKVAAIKKVMVLGGGCLTLLLIGSLLLSGVLLLRSCGGGQEIGKPVPQVHERPSINMAEGTGGDERKKDPTWLRGEVENLKKDLDTIQQKWRQDNDARIKAVKEGWDALPPEQQQTLPEATVEFIKFLTPQNPPAASTAGVNNPGGGAGNPAPTHREPPENTGGNSSSPIVRVPLSSD